MSFFKTFKVALDSHKKDVDSWTKAWEKPDFIKYMQGYKDTDPSRLAIGLVKPNSKVLSAGCGSGREVKYLVTIGCRTTAIDHSEKMIKESKKIEPKARYFLGDATMFLPKEKFDFVLCLFNTMNYFGDFESRQRFVKNSYKNLKRGGKLIIITKHCFSHPGTIYRRIIQRHDFYFLPSQIKRWFNGSGFNIEKIRVGKTLLIVAEKR